jgi:hypothetical protein
MPQEFIVTLPNGKKTKPYTRSKIAAALTAAKLPEGCTVDGVALEDWLAVTDAVEASMPVSSHAGARDTSAVVQRPEHAKSGSNNLTTCPDCSREVSCRATVCPHCGAPLQKSMFQAGLDAVAAGLGAASALLTRVCVECSSPNVTKLPSLSLKAPGFTGRWGRTPTEVQFGLNGSETVEVRKFRCGDCGCIWQVASPADFERKRFVAVLLSQPDIHIAQLMEAHNAWRATISQENRALSEHALADGRLIKLAAIKAGLIPDDRMTLKNSLLAAGVLIPLAWVLPNWFPGTCTVIGGLLTFVYILWFLFMPFRRESRHQLCDNWAGIILALVCSIILWGRGAELSPDFVKPAADQKSQDIEEIHRN